MNFMEIEEGIWIAPDLVTAVEGVVGSTMGTLGGHHVNIYMMGGQVVTCRDHSDPSFFAPKDRPDCYLVVIPQDEWFEPGGWTLEKKQQVASAHAAEVQAQIAMYRSPVTIRPLS